MNIRATVGTLLLLLSLQACTSNKAEAGDDTATGLTISGRTESIDAFLHSTEAAPHQWVIERRWADGVGSQSIRLRWPDRPSLSDIGGIVALAQTAKSNGLAISDTQIVETYP